MKVDPRLPARSLWPAPSQDAARDGVSFAQMLEGGTSAAQVVGNRALGFAEAGLMGLHFALGEVAVPPPGPSTARPDTAGSDRARSDRAGPAPAAPAAFTARAECAASPGSPRSAQTRAGPAADGAAMLRPAGNAAAASAIPAESALSLQSTGQDAAEPRPPEEPALTGRIAARIARLSSNPVPPRVRLREEAAGVAVIIDGYVPDGETSSDLEQLVRATVAEFGMTATGVLVTPTRGIGNTTKRGN
ncbi:MAG: hypothetical protein KGN34_09970 [Sphingomonadales bacterium]|nr:hypothetical protein [Sphingomonadales bacterium]